jgi:hypothetical protein
VRCGRGRGQGGSVGFEFARVGEGGDKGGVKVYEAYEVKKKGGKLRCLVLRRIFFNIFFCYEVIVKQKKKNAPPITTCVCVCVFAH